MMILVHKKLPNCRQALMYLTRNVMKWIFDGISFLMVLILWTMQSFEHVLTHAQQISSCFKFKFMAMSLWWQECGEKPCKCCCYINIKFLTLKLKRRPENYQWQLELAAFICKKEMDTLVVECCTVAVLREFYYNLVYSYSLFFTCFTVNQN